MDVTANMNMYFVLIFTLCGVTNGLSEQQDTEVVLRNPALILVSLASLLAVVVVVTLCAKCGCKVEPRDRDEPDIIITQATPSIHVTNISSATGQPTTVTNYHTGGEIVATGYRMS